LTFGTISSLFGLSHHIIDQGQYSILVAGVIGSAVVPTLIANAFFRPHHLLPQPAGDDGGAGDCRIRGKAPRAGAKARTDSAYIGVKPTPKFGTPHDELYLDCDWQRDRRRCALLVHGIRGAPVW